MISNCCVNGKHVRWQFLELPSDTHLILDSAPWHMSADATCRLDEIPVNTHVIPGACGKWLNPCDQAINHVIRQEFLRLQRLRGNAHKIQNIISA